MHMTDSQRRSIVRRIRTIAAVARAHDSARQHPHEPDLQLTAVPKDDGLRAAQ